MPSFHLEHTLECQQDTYWDKLFFDVEYNQRMFHEELHFSEWRELEQRNEGERRIRVVRATPPVPDLPGALKRLIGEGIGYEEHGSYDRRTHRYDARAVPTRLADRVTITLFIATEPLGENRAKRIVESSVTAKIPMLGGLLEQRMVSDMSRSYEKSAHFTNRFLAEKGLR